MYSCLKPDKGGRETKINEFNILILLDCLFFY